MMRRSDSDSSTCAAQPETREVAKSVVKSSFGMSAPVRTTEAQKSTLVALGRSGAPHGGSSVRPLRSVRRSCTARRRGLGHLAQDLRPRSYVRVHAVAETRESVVPRVSSVSHFSALSRTRSCRACCVPRAWRHHVPVLERGDRADDARRQSLPVDATTRGGEGRRVESVVGEQDEVRVDEVDLVPLRLLPSIIQSTLAAWLRVVSWLDRLLALAAAPGRTEDGREIAVRAIAFVQRRLGQCLGRACAETTVRRTSIGSVCESIAASVPRAEALSLRAAASADAASPAPFRWAARHAITGTRPLRRSRRDEVFDQVTAAVDETAVGAVDFADGGFSGHHTFQPGLNSATSI